MLTVDMNSTQTAPSGLAMDDILSTRAKLETEIIYERVTARIERTPDQWIVQPH